MSTRTPLSEHVIFPLIDYISNKSEEVWHIVPTIRENTFVKKGNPLFTIESDKQVQSILAPFDGIAYNVNPSVIDLEGEEIMRFKPGSPPKKKEAPKINVDELATNERAILFDNMVRDAEDRLRRMAVRETVEPGPLYMATVAEPPRVVEGGLGLTPEQWRNVVIRGYR